MTGNSLDPDQVRHNVVSDPDPNSLYNKVKASVHDQSVYYVYIVLSADKWKLSEPRSGPSQCRIRSRSKQFI